METLRTDGRACDMLRPIIFERAINRYAEGSALIRWGNTHVLCTASVDDKSAALPSRLGQRLDNGGIRDAPALDAEPHAARDKPRKARRARQRDTAAHRPLAARRRRHDAPRRTHDNDRLRRSAGRRRHEDSVDIRGLRRALRRAAQNVRRRQNFRNSAQKPDSRRQRRQMPRRSAARPVL